VDYGSVCNTNRRHGRVMFLVIQTPHNSLNIILTDLYMTLPKRVLTHTEI